MQGKISNNITTYLVLLALILNTESFCTTRIILIQLVAAASIIMTKFLLKIFTQEYKQTPS